MHAAATAVSAYFNAVLADRLTGTFGLSWEQRRRRPDRKPQWEIFGVPDGLIREFSGRTRAIEVEKERMIQAYVAPRTPAQQRHVRGVARAGDAGDQA